ncbi:MAG: M20/M25/M40 family metallo-hydrolase [Chloroflexota bacterium]
MLAVLVAGTLACGGKVEVQSPSPEPTSTTMPTMLRRTSPSVSAAPNAADFLAARLPQVSVARLEADVRALAALPSRHVNSDGISLAADLLLQSFRQAGEGIEVYAMPFPLVFAEVTTQQRNIVVRIIGWDETAGAVLIGAHYDSRAAAIDDWVSPALGANDNATGVAALLEIVRLLAGYRPRATVLLAAFSAEETGLQGSGFYVTSGVIEPENIRAMIAPDILGNSAGEAGAGSVRCFAGGGAGSPSLQLAAWLADLARQYVPGLEVLVQERLDRPGRYSDHVPFFEAGIPAVRLIEAIEHLEWQHNAEDRPERVDSRYLAQVTRLALAAVVELSEDPQRFLDAAGSP